MSQSPPVAPKPRPSLARRLVRFVFRAVLALVSPILLYLLVALVGMIPVNNGFVPTPDGVEILVTSTEVHADVVMPVRHQVIDWREHLPPSCFSGDVSKAAFVAAGWGNKKFYVGTPSWDDVKVSTVAEALLTPSEACMHVEYWDARDVPETARRVRISAEQYQRLAAFVRGTFRTGDDGRFVEIKGAAYGRYDAFFEAHGAYHCFNTCNCWAGRAVREAGLRAGWFTPLPKTPLYYLPEAR